MKLHSIMYKTACFFLLSPCLHSAEKIERHIGTIAVIGSGYVGLVAGACMASIGNTVVCTDIIKEKIVNLQKGIIPIYEPGLERLIVAGTQTGLLSFTDDIEKAIDNANIIFIAVGTPMAEDGSADESAIISVVNMIAQHMQRYKIICTKSTVPVGTGALIKKFLIDRGVSSDMFDVVSNPEFLREGSAIQDFLRPDRIIIGAEHDDVHRVMRSVYKKIVDDGTPIMHTNIATAEVIKYASNAFLATKISFINEMASYCKKVGASISMVARGMGLDRRIGRLFLQPGPGFGGSCFPKDCSALLYMGNKTGDPFFVVHAALRANEYQKGLAAQKVIDLLGTPTGKTVAVLGLAFKANTDDVRFSPSITTIQKLQQWGVVVKGYDPVAMKTAKQVLPDIIYASSAYEAVEKADACIIMTEWPGFKDLDWNRVALSMRTKIVIDMRLLLDRSVLESAGFIYDGVG